MWVVKVDESGWDLGEHVFVFLSFLAKLQLSEVLVLLAGVLAV